MRFVVRSGSNSVGGKIFATLFGLVFAGFGLFFCYLMARPLVDQYATWFWPATDCAIESSQFVDASTATEKPANPFRFDVRYRYTWQGQEHTSSTFRRGYEGGDDPAEAQRLAARFPVGSTARCYVNPKPPTESALVRPRLTGLLLFLFPLIFVAFGLGLVVMSWRGASATSTATGGGPAVTPIGKPEMSPLKMFGCASAFFGVFAVFGLLFFIPFFGLPMWRLVKARSWNAVPCTVVSSEVGSHSGSKGGSTYSVDVVYHYTVGGHEYTGNRYGFVSGSSSGRSGKEEAVARLPAGTETTCYVNPDDPTDAVLNREFSRDMLFGLIPLVFVAVGLGGILIAGIAIRRGAVAKGISQWVPGVRKERALGDQPLGMPRVSELADDPRAPRALKPAQTPLGKLGCAIFLAIFVGGLVGTFVWKGVLEPMRQGGHPEGCLMIFLIPFALIALGLIVNVPYQILALFNPRPRFELEPGVLAPGERSRLRWRFTGMASRLSRVQITLEGREEATHRVGTTTRTDTSIFLQQTILDCASPEQIANGGEAAIELPANLVHTFTASHNKIAYKLKLQGTVARWPDLADEFEIDVAPEGGSR